jgi:hypothetical protein
MKKLHLEALSNNKILEENSNEIHLQKRRKVHLENNTRKKWADSKLV